VREEPRVRRPVRPRGNVNAAVRGVRDGQMVWVGWGPTMLYGFGTGGVVQTLCDMSVKVWHNANDMSSTNVC
jgi:hypothetical protein